MNEMTIGLSAHQLAELETDPAFLAYLGKQEPGGGDVHVSSAGGGKKPKQPKKPILDFDELEDQAGSAGTHASKAAADKAIADMEAAHAAEKAALLKKLGGHGDELEQLAKLLKVEAPRALKPHEDGGAYSPFPYHPQSLDSLHDDQRRRFLGAMTDQDKQEDKRVPIKSLVALQPRVDPEKIESMRRRISKAEMKKPLVVRWGGRNYLADGHHRAAAAWLNGADHIDAKFTDMSGKDQELNKTVTIIGKVSRVDEKLGVVFGYAIVCKVDGEDYYDLNIDQDGERVPEHIPEDAMLKSSTVFMEHHRVAKEMHSGDQTGQVVHSLPLTTDIAKALDIVTDKTGWIIGMKPSKAALAKYASGEYTGFSIGGVRIRNEEID